MDRLTKAKRSEVMRNIRSRNTLPEIAARKMLFSLGYRFRLHSRSLPGHPDIVLPKYRTAIFVHGCFWHQHQGCIDASKPKSQPEYWAAKLSRNVQRDKQRLRVLRRLGWRVSVVWACDLEKRPAVVRARFARICKAASV